MRWIVLLILAVAAAACTTTKYIPVESVRERYAATARADTLIARDSIVIEHAGDTIRETRWRERWRTSVYRDTLRLTDTIKEPYAVEVTAKLSRWERTKQDWGGVAMGCLAALAMGTAARMVWRLKHKT